MHYVIRRSHQMQKHKFRVMCPSVLFVESVPLPPKHEKWCVDVSRPRRTEIHYVTHRSQKLQKHNLGVTISIALFTETAHGPLEHEK
jgi:hypothetical protein